MKNPFKSKTIWGVVLTAAGPYATTALGAAGVTNAPEVIDAAVTVGGALLAVYGRYKATKALAVK